MTTPSVIAGVYADLRQVKSRGVWQLVLDIPAEKVEGMVELFGMPRQDEPTWLAVARLKVSPGSVRAVHGVAAEGNPPPPSTVPGESKRERTLPEKVGMRCADPAFQVWIERQTGRADIGEMEAAAWVRKECVVESRKAILPGTEAAALWLALETRFLEDTRQMAERRR